MSFTYEEIIAERDSLYKLARETGIMLYEAQGQWLGSCAECYEQYKDDDLDDLKREGSSWADDMLEDSYGDIYQYWFADPDSIFPKGKDGAFHWKGQSLYTWLVWAISDDTAEDVHYIIAEWAEGRDLPLPQWYLDQLEE